MIVYGEYRVEGEKTVYSATCERCMNPIGNLDLGELLALLSGEYGPVLCFSCEGNSCPTCGYQLSERARLDVEEFGECFFCRLEREGNKQ